MSVYEEDVSFREPIVDPRTVIPNISGPVEKQQIDDDVVQNVELSRSNASMKQYVDNIANTLRTHANQAAAAVAVPIIANNLSMSQEVPEESEDNIANGSSAIALGEGTKALGDLSITTGSGSAQLCTVEVEGEDVNVVASAADAEATEITISVAHPLIGINSIISFNDSPYLYKVQAVNDLVLTITPALIEAIEADSTIISHRGVAYGKASQIIGTNNINLGDNSLVVGSDLVGDAPEAIILGKYNERHTVDKAFVIGGGTGDLARKNIFSVDTDGVAECLGIIVKSSTAESTKRFRITVDDTGAITATEVV